MNHRMDAACAVCRTAFPKIPPAASLALSSGERVCASARCREAVAPCAYCQWTGISHQPVQECTGPGCGEAICQLCEESFSSHIWDRKDRLCEHAVYND